MASGIYNRFKFNILKGVVDLVNDTCKVMLLDNTHTFNADHDVIADVNANEIAPGSGNGYTDGGETITTPTVTQDDANDLAQWDADDVSWTTATFDAYHAVIYDVTATSNLIASIDFSGIKSVSNGTFTIQWNVNGILRLS